MFNADTGGRPNGVVTFRSHLESPDHFEGPLISVLVESAHKTSSNKYTYQLGQSADQEEVKDFFVDSAKKGGEEHDVVTAEYETFSLFIAIRANRYTRNSGVKMYATTVVLNLRNSLLAPLCS